MQKYCCLLSHSLSLFILLFLFYSFAFPLAVTFGAIVTAALPQFLQCWRQTIPEYGSLRPADSLAYRYRQPSYRRCGQLLRPLPRPQIRYTAHMEFQALLRLFLNTSGSGFAFDTFVPSIISSNKEVRFSLSKISGAFLLADPSASL